MHCPGMIFTLALFFNQDNNTQEQHGSAFLSFCAIFKCCFTALIVLSAFISKSRHPPEYHHKNTVDF